MATQRITTNDVRDRITELGSILQKNNEMEQAVTAGIQAMNSGITFAMQFNMTSKALSVLLGLKALTEALQQGKTVLGQVVSAYESADANLKKNVEDWVGGTQILNSAETEGYNNAAYTTIKYESCIMDQTRFDGPEFGYKNENGGCTSTSWCMGLSMITGKQYDPTASNMWGKNGAKFPGQGKSVWGNQEEMLSEAYHQLQQGKPSVFYANHRYGTDLKSSCMHAVTIVGVKSDADPNNLTMNDFLVVDPWKGVVKSLDEVNYYDYSGRARLITYGDNLP